ncbi:hypothetical protein B7494_g385 [Chlorociboria aeruginascens]|nr:hypothetical protein B7494_g385 [Chlorociboria aeruginascens]
MAPKRPFEETESTTAPQAKKQRSGFKVGPDNLPDGTWRRKIVKIKKDLIHKAKVKKTYATIKAREAVLDALIPAAAAEPVVAPSHELHPERQAMLDAPEEPIERPRPRQGQRRGRKPGYFEKEQAFAERKRREAEDRRLEFERRDGERKQKIEERERFRRTMAKARTGGRNGQRKLGLESKALLEKVKRAVA